MAHVARYGTWRSPLDLRAMFERPSPPMYPVSYRGNIYWIESRSSEQGRQVLMCRNHRGEEHCQTPAGFNLRTRVHEYGGRCFVLANGFVYFSNYGDSLLYRQQLRPNSRPSPVTQVESGAVTMVSDLHVSPDGRHLVCVAEQTAGDRENRNFLGVVDLKARSPQPVRRLVEGADFYASPAISPDGAQFAWLQWDHPYMPWDQSVLMLAQRDGGADLRLTHIREVAGGAGMSVCQVRFTSRDELLFALDSDTVADPCDDFWNLYLLRRGRVRRLTCDEAEYGAPHWVFGESRFVPVADRAVLAVRTTAAGDEVVRIDLASGAQRLQTPHGFMGFAQLSEVEGTGGALVVAHSLYEPPALMRCQPGRAAWECIKRMPPALGRADVSVAEPITYPTRDGAQSHAYFYGPKNSAYLGPHGTRPPLMIMVHGGPTSRAVRSLDLARQYWTGIGFAVLDVNHRGSTGHGRRFRQSLLGHWGEFDASDIVDGIDFLYNRGLIDRSRVCIRGRSAGGYAVLRVLTEYPDYFSAGACYFGIGNLVTLTESTHKFESHYTDRLIGEVFDPRTAATEDSAFHRRSPINYMFRARSPMIIFQGRQDKVVPPSVAEELVAALRANGVEHEYVEYENEGHGFRASETNIDALTRETAFYGRVLELC